MPMILAMNGAEFGEFGATSQAIGDLQTALVGLGKAIGDNALSKIAIDGVIGPKTAAATNRALTVHLGAGQAPANLRTGSLSQSVIVSQAQTITGLIDAEIARRGFSLPVSKKILAKTTKPKVAKMTEMVQYTPPAPAAAVPTGPVYRIPTALPPSGTDMNAIIKWSAIGFGAVAVLGIAYYVVTKKPTGAPAMAGLGSVARRNDHERAQWVENDEGLYNWYKSQSYPLREFVKKNRVEIDAAIDSVLNRKPR